MRSILCLALLCSWAIACAAPAPELAAPKKPPPPGTLHSISVKGNRLYSSLAIIQASGLKIGDRVTAATIEQARKKLQDTELFSNVTDEYRFSIGTPVQYDLTFEVSETSQLFPVRFERLDVSPEELRKYLRDHVELYAGRIPGTEGVLHRYSAAIQDFLTQSNSKPPKVHAIVSNDDPKELAVVFSPETPAPAISQVIVTGNKAVDSGAILRAVNAVAIGVPVSDARLQSILNGAIKPLYAAKGYAAVSFPKVETEPSRTDQGVVVKVEIKDGPAFTFGSIRFRGTGMDEDEIRANIPFKPGQAFNAEQMDNFRLDLAHRLRRHGYLDATVLTDSQTDDSKHTVNVTYTVAPGSIYNFEKLDVQGLDVTTEPVIAKLWGEKPGRPFNPDYPDFFLKRVEEQGIFEHLGDTRSDYTADASTHNVTVHLYFKGGDSKQERARKKKEEDEKRTTDGTWSPWPWVLPPG
jgi:outer membrane protein insertion porin family